jgi:Cys-tRNA synthase (O-phospho-L-seryl-tRNA:Cys-tRNA synthase)
MFQLLEFCDTISYCDEILSSEFRTIKSCPIKDMREEDVILG